MRPARGTALPAADPETGPASMRRIIALFALVREDLRILWTALRDPRRPRWLRPAVAALLLYLLSPVDLIPDTIPLFGVVDDLLLIPLLTGWIVRRLPPELRRGAADDIGR